jgi:alkanesulfonate monooxygenase SsuD/methylene tetrahydromethanopterin reductase-like flavin-dependent oxidoreductase (luciferase family)
MEAAGWDYIFCNETPGSDALGGAFLLAGATKKATIGTSVANIYLRHPYLTARTSAMLQVISGGRFILGLGASHPLINKPLGLGSTHPIRDMYHYINSLRGYFGSEPSPVWVGALRPPMARLAGELSDGVIFHLVPLSGIARVVESIREGERQGRRSRHVTIAAYGRISLTNDMSTARVLARQMLRFYFRFPAYQDLFSKHGFAEDVEAYRAAIQRQDDDVAGASISDRLIEETCILGGALRCRDIADQYRAAGVDVMLFAPLRVEGSTLASIYEPVLNAFKQA